MDRISGLFLLLSITVVKSQQQFFEQLQHVAKAHQKDFRYDDKFVHETDDYDFIIVGAGSSGSVLANRLTENFNWTVLLLEAGGEPNFFTEAPFMAPVFQTTGYNWGYTMERQANFSLGLVNKRMPWPRGRAIGGTSIINYMIHVRGNPLDYDRWAALGNPGWSYNEVFPYFLKSENSKVASQHPAYHNRDGYLDVEDVPYRTESAQAFIRAAQQFGMAYVDYNGPQQLGVSYVHATMRQGRRCSAEKAFLRPARARHNLFVLQWSRVTKILIDPSSKRAYGVEYLRRKRLRTATASKEVIISAGALASPQLLMLSGIGPQNILRKFKIPQIQNLPVGQKLYDHLTFLGLVFAVNESITLTSNDYLNWGAISDVILSGTGPLTSLGGVEALAYIQTPQSEEPVPYPDVELIYVGSSIHADRGNIIKRAFGINDRVYNAIWRPLEGKHAWTVFPMLLHPKSFGYLTLKSKNPLDPPLFFGNYLTDPGRKDLKTFIAAIRTIQKLSKMPAFRKYDTKQVTTPIPGCERVEFDSDEYWECGMRSISSTLHHQVATCKMGPENDPEAVVDARLRVHGVRSLRVVDTSVIPIPLSAHTNVPAIMVGEKASDIIKEDWDALR